MHDEDLKAEKLCVPKKYEIAFFILFKSSGFLMPGFTSIYRRNLACLIINIFIVSFLALCLALKFSLRDFKFKTDIGNFS